MRRRVKVLRTSYDTVLRDKLTVVDRKAAAF